MGKGWVALFVLGMIGLSGGPGTSAGPAAPAATPVEASGDELVTMEVAGVVEDPDSGTPVVILRDQDRETLLPIWIGPFEARAIAMELEEVEPPRPLSHDLMHTLVEELGAQVDRIVVTDLRDGTYFAEVFLSRKRKEYRIDAPGE